eukprot:COSAG06_NODE_41980_length_386_cov_0.452962_1_plen_37_part_10
MRARIFLVVVISAKTPAVVMIMLVAINYLLSVVVVVV